VPTFKPKRWLWDTYAFPCFRPDPTVRDVFGDPRARVITLKMARKNRLQWLWPGARGPRGEEYLRLKILTCMLLVL
jgi:hypothetical protein